MESHHEGAGPFRVKLAVVAEAVKPLAQHLVVFLLVLALQLVDEEFLKALQSETTHVLFFSKLILVLSMGFSVPRRSELLQYIVFVVSFASNWLGVVNAVAESLKFLVAQLSGGEHIVLPENVFHS